jgi:fatty acid synthase
MNESSNLFAADGYVRSEAICVLFLQRARDAKRVYAKVVHAKTNSDGYKDEGLTYPSRESQTQLMEQFYQEIGMKPTSVDFLEAHGTGTRVSSLKESIYNFGHDFLTPKQEKNVYIIMCLET